MSDASLDSFGFVQPTLTGTEVLSGTTQVTLAGVDAMYDQPISTPGSTMSEIDAMYDQPISTPGPTLAGIDSLYDQQSTQTNPSDKQNVLENPLHDYQSYTYCLSWHMLGVDVYNSVVNNDSNGIKYVPKNVLVSSAGKWDNTSFVRNSNFKEDFYFDNLKLKTIINPTKRNGSSNLIECEFVLIEPTGFTLINRLLSASKEIRAVNDSYIHVPYALQIDFYGYNDDNTGPSLIKDQTKILPIRLISLKSKITARGTEYQISAVPFNHQAFSQLNVASPFAYSVTANNVKDFFGSGKIDSAYVSKVKNLQREEQQLRDALTNSPLFDELASTLTDRLSVVTAQYRTPSEVSGYCDAINGWFNSLVTQNSIKIANKISVIFSDEIGNASLYPNTGPVNVAQVPAGGADYQSKTAAIQTAGGSNKGQLNFNGSTLSIPENTSVEKLIDWAVRNSSYIGDQLTKDPALLKEVQSGKTPTVPLRWFKIVPKIKIIDYDISQNKYALDITYYVKPYTMSSKFPYAPTGRVSGYVKKYDYLYTGKNKDVIDMQIDFDMMYYVKLTAFRAKQKLTETAPGVGGGDNDSPTSKQQTTNPNQSISNPANNIAPVTVGYVADSKMVTRTGGSPQLAVDAANLQDSLLLDARGDMINLNLRIIGDPQLIKQDDVFYGQDANVGAGSLTKNGSIWMDNGELYVFVNFKTPVDYDESTGIADPNSGKYKVSEYSGVYKIITVENNFIKGKFEQTLQMVKLLFDQEGNSIFSGNGFSTSDRATSSLSLTELLDKDLGYDAKTSTAGALLLAAASGRIGSIAQNQVDQAISGIESVVSGKINDVKSIINDKITEALKPYKDKIDEFTSAFSKNVSDFFKSKGTGTVTMSDLDAMYDTNPGSVTLSGIDSLYDTNIYGSSVASITVPGVDNIGISSTLSDLDAMYLDGGFASDLDQDLYFS